MNTDRILRLGDVKAATGLSRSTIYRLESEGKFPRRVQLGENSVGWSAKAVGAWVASRAPAASTSVAAA